MSAGQGHRCIARCLSAEKNRTDQVSPEICHLTERGDLTGQIFWLVSHPTRRAFPCRYVAAPRQPPYPARRRGQAAIFNKLVGGRRGCLQHSGFRGFRRHLQRRVRSGMYRIPCGQAGTACRIPGGIASQTRLKTSCRRQGTWRQPTIQYCKSYRLSSVA